MTRKKRLTVYAGTWSGSRRRAPPRATSPAGSSTSSSKRKRRAAVLFPVAEEGGARFACRRGGGTAKLLGDEQRLVVIARQRGERRISLRRQILAETSAPCAKASSARSPRNSIRQPAAYGSRGTNPASLVLGAMPSESCRTSRVIVVASLRAALSHGHHEFRRRRIVSRRATILVVQLPADHGRHGDDAK